MAIRDMRVPIRLLKLIVRMIVVAAAAATLAACASTQASKPDEEASPFEGFSTTEIIEAGDKAMQQGESDRAAFIYMQALEIEETADTWFRLGLAKLRLEDTTFAWNAFRTALEYDANHGPTHEELGLLYVGSGQPDQARPHLEKAIEIDPSRWRAHNALGIMADVRKQYQKAVDHYKAALEYYPESAMLMNNIGYSYYLAGDLQEATSWLDAAIQAQPGYELAVRNLSLLYARQGWYDEAIATFVRVIEKPQAYNDIGYIALRNGDYEDAGMLLSEAIRLSPVYYETAYQNMELLESTMKRAGVKKQQETSAKNISEVIFAEGHETLSLSVMPQALNVRAAPGQDAEIIDYLKTGDMVEVLMAKDKWSFVSYRPDGVDKDLTGWVKSRFLSGPSVEEMVPFESAADLVTSVSQPASEPIELSTNVDGATAAATNTTDFIETETSPD